MIGESPPPPQNILLGAQIHLHTATGGLLTQFRVIARYAAGDTLCEESLAVLPMGWTYFIEVCEAKIREKKIY